MGKYRIVEVKREEEHFLVAIEGLDRNGYPVSDQESYPKEVFETKVIPELEQLEAFRIKVSQIYEGVYSFVSRDNILPFPKDMCSILDIKVDFKDNNGCVKEVLVDYSEVYNGLNSK